MPMDFFASSGQHEINGSHLDNVFDDLKTPEVIKLDTHDIKPVSLLNIHQKTKLLKENLTVLFNTGERYSLSERNLLI